MQRLLTLGTLPASPRIGPWGGAEQAGSPTEAASSIQGHTMHYRNDGHPCPTTSYPCAIRSSIGTPHRTSWGQIRRALTTHDRPRPADKGRAPCWAPHRLDSTARRKIGHVEDIHALVLDYDDGLDVAGAMAVFPDAERCAHSTYSATDGKPKCRLILPLAAPVPAPIWSAAYRLILADLGRAEQAADPKCVDPSRLYLLPVAGPIMEAAHENGDLLDIGHYVAEADYQIQIAAIAAAEREAQRARRAHAARQWADRADRADGPDPERRARVALRTRPDVREAAACDLRAKIADRDGAKVAHGIPCPGCGRPDVWFVVDPRGAWSARCNHAQTCGWHGPLTELIAAHGLSLARYGAP